MERCRRSGREFFDFCCGLLSMQLDEAKAVCRARFPPGPGPLHLQAEMHLVLSHRRRLRLNELCQEAAAARYRSANPGGLVVRLKPEHEAGSANLAQPFDLFEGTRLLGVNGSCRRIVSGSLLVVGQVRTEDCDVTDEYGNSFALSHQQLGRCTRLAWAITVTASQSREFEGSICLWDLGNPYYSGRHLYTAITRAKGAAGVVVAP